MAQVLMVVFPPLMAQQGRDAQTHPGAEEEMEAAAQPHTGQEGCIGTLHARDLHRFHFEIPTVLSWRSNLPWVSKTGTRRHTVSLHWRGMVQHSMAP